jgi:arylsulfatase A-like enzyme
MDNVLFITIDSLRADHVGCYGYEKNTTPNIDELASNGGLFSNAFAHACSTRPSFPSILASSSALMYGGYERISNGRTLISEVFNQNGYETGGFHSNLYLGADFGYDRGFDKFFDSKTDPTTMAKVKQFVRDRLDEDGFLYNSMARTLQLAELCAGTSVGSAYVNAGEITDRALEWVDRTERDSPHFLWVHYMDVHHPYVPPEEHQLVFRDSPIKERRAVQLRRKMLENPDSISKAELDDIVDLYDAEIRFTDSEIGRLIENVNRIWGDVLVAVTADHGEEFQEHGGFSHLPTFYDEVTHVPLVINDGHHRGRYEDMVGLQDIAPTLVDFAEISAPDNFHGHSLLPLLDGKGWQRTSILGDWKDTDTGERRFSYRDDRWKFIERDGSIELYDLSRDPKETTNVVDTHEDVAETLRERIQEYKNEIETTRMDIDDVEMDEQVRRRLIDLGYQE